MKEFISLIKIIICTAGNTLMILTRKNLGLHQYSFYALDEQDDTKNHLLNLGLKWIFPLSSVLIIGLFLVGQFIFEPSKSMLPFIFLLIICSISGFTYLANNELNSPENSEYDTMGINPIVQKVLNKKQKEADSDDLESQSNLFEIALWVNVGLIAFIFGWFVLSVFFFFCSFSIAILSLNRRQKKRQRRKKIYVNSLNDRKIQAIIKKEQQKKGISSLGDGKQKEKPVATLINHNS